jgi:Flp pilus assembly protein TadG
VRDTAANVMAISAASLVPILAMVGGGVDASRYYMTQTRLQQACDSGVLAARRAMLTETLTNEARDTGEAFFDQNYSEGIFGT